MDKRTFLKQGTLAALAMPSVTSFLEQLNLHYASFSASDLAKEEDYWAEIRKGYRLKSEYINLENGYYNFMPEATLNHLIGHMKMVNYEASNYMRTVQFTNKEKVAARLADLMGCGHDELIVTRNTTESLDSVINGYDWKAGDEAVMAEQDYGSMLNQFKLIASRYGIVNKILSVPTHPVSDDEIVDLYASAITDKTRLLMVCHIINITGQILPIRKICDMAHARGVDVLVDGAHAVGHFQYAINDLNCDYYGSSLHKWLSTPLGAGILYVKKEKIQQIWPTFAAWNNDPADIRKLNQTGTHPAHTDLTINDAIDYYLAIGKERKEARLRYLQRYWSEQVRELPGIEMFTPKEEHRSCGIANVGISGMTASLMAKKLMDDFQIFVVPIDGQGIKGCRITPNVYTTTAELDRFVEALNKMVA